MSDPIRCWVRSPQVLAVQYDGSFELDWLREGEKISAAMLAGGERALVIESDEGRVVLALGHWLIRSVEDPTDLTSCSPEEFDARYIRVGVTEGAARS